MQELSTGIYSGNVLNRIEDLGLVCSHTSYLSDNFNRERHFHQNPHISFVVSGFCTEKKRDLCDRIPGHIAFYHAGEPHQVYGVSENSRHINIEVTPKAFERFGMTDEDLEMISNGINTKFSMLQVYRAILNNATGDIEFLFSEMLTTPGSRRSQPSWVEILESYLKDNYATSPDLTALAMIAGVHPVTVSKYFRRYFGCTLSSYMRKLKTHRALHLIKNSRKTLTQISFECGFADQSHFNRSFKELAGVMPGEYRKL